MSDIKNAALQVIGETICYERWGESGHELTDWDERTARAVYDALESAGLTVVRASQDLLDALDIVRQREPKPTCAQPSKKKYSTKANAIMGAREIELRTGDQYDPLYPYECPAGGHWHLSHYQQGTARCPVCQLPKPAWRGGESYWVIAKHTAITTTCNGTGARVYDR